MDGVGVGGGDAPPISAAPVKPMPAIPAKSAVQMTTLKMRIRMSAGMEAKAHFTIKRTIDQKGISTSVTVTRGGGKFS